VYLHKNFILDLEKAFKVIFTILTYCSSVHTPQQSWSAPPGCLLENSQQDPLQTPT